MAGQTSGGYRSHERIFSLLAQLFAKPARRDDLVGLGYERGDTGDKRLRRDIDKAGQLGYPILYDAEAAIYRIDREHLAEVSITGEDLTMLRLAVSSLTERGQLHEVARRTLNKLLGHAREEEAEEAIALRVELSEHDMALTIVEAIAHRRPLSFDYDAASHEVRAYRVEPCRVWRMGRAYYLAARRIAVGPDKAHLEECPAEARSFRLTRISGLTVEDPGHFSTDLSIESGAFRPVDATVRLAEGAGEHLRERFGAHGDTVRIQGMATADFIDEMNLLGEDAWTDDPDYRTRLEHLANLGEK